MTKARSRRTTWLRRIFWAVVAVEWAAVVALSVLFLLPLWHAPTRRAMIELVCLDPASTTYAAGFTDRAWLAIREGDTRAQALGALGEPLDRWDDDALWSYSRQTTPTDSYWVRSLRFDRLGRIMRKNSECYVD